MEYKKKDETTLKVVKTIKAKTEENEYDLNFLKQQEINILRQKNEFMEARDRELEEVRNLIKQAENLGIKLKEEIDTQGDELPKATDDLDEELTKAKVDLDEMKKELVDTKETIESNISDVVSDLSEKIKGTE